MVDINLFKEGEDEEMDWESSDDQEMEAPSGQTPETEPEDFGSDDFDFDSDEMEEPDSFDDDSFLDDQDGEPAIDQHPEEDAFNEEDYDFGDAKEKKVPIWLIIILGLVVILAATYFLWYQPKMKSGKQISHAAQVQRPEVVTPPVSQTDSSGVEVAGQDSVAATLPVEKAVVPVASGSSNATQKLIQPMKQVVQNLGSINQFGSVIVTGNRFFVEYVSDSPNASSAMAQRIQNLLGVATVKKSPEEKYTRGGRIKYSGVISGQFDDATLMKPTGSSQYGSKDAFIQQMKNIAKQSGLVFKSGKTLDSPSSEPKEVTIEIKIEGAQKNAIQFLDSVVAASDHYNISKVLMVPKEYSDFSASQVRVVVDFLYFQ